MPQASVMSLTVILFKGCSSSKVRKALRIAFFVKVAIFIPPIIESDIAQAFALVISGIVTYCLFKYFAFKKKKPKVAV